MAGKEEGSSRVMHCLTDHATVADLVLAVESSSELEGINHLKEMTVQGVDSAHSRRAYETAIEEFIAWNLHYGKIRINASQLRAYQTHLSARHSQSSNHPGQLLAPSTINVKMAAVRSLVHSASAAGWITEADVEQILKRLHARPITGRREGQRMPLADVQRCLRLPDRTTLQGKRDYAILGILFACGLRRAELCNLKVETIGPLNGGWALIDLVGKRQKVRSIPLEAPIKQGIDEWLAAGKVKGGVIFRAIRKNGKVWGTGLDESAIWEIVRHYAALVGHPNFAPHDARRTCARIYYDAKAPLKQIQFLLGHDKLDTTARYVNDEQKFGGEALSKLADIS